MGGRQITHNNHTVPRFYLRRWSNNGSTVNCYNTIRHREGQKKWSSESIKSMSVWKDIYTQVADEQADDSIEFFFSEYEDRASIAIEALESGDVLSESNMASLVDFAIVQMVRTPRWLTEQNGVIADVFNTTVEETVLRVFDKAVYGGLTTRDGQSEEQAELSSAPFPPPPMDFSLDKERGEMVTVLSVGQRSSLYAMGRVLTGDVANTMRSYSWAILEMPSNLELPTSDDPFVRLKVWPSGRYTIRCGVGEPGALLFMPITPRHILATIVGKGRPGQSLLRSEAVCNLIYRSIVENAHLHVFSKKRDERIEAIRPSEINHGYLQEFEKAKNEWFGT